MRSILWLMGLTLFSGLVSCGKGSDSSPEKKESLEINEDQGVVSASGFLTVIADWKEPLKAGGDGDNVVRLQFVPRLDPEKFFQINIHGFHPRMPAMGNHGTDERTQKITLQKDNLPTKTFIVSGIFFNMGGAEHEWVVTVDFLVDGMPDFVQLLVPKVHSS